MDNDRPHPIHERIKEYELLTVSSTRQPGVPAIRLRLTYRHRTRKKFRHLDFDVPLDQSPSPATVFPFNTRALRFIDRTGAGWESPETEIHFMAEYPWPLHAEFVGETNEERVSRPGGE